MIDMISVPIQEGVSVTISGNIVTVRGSLGENKRRFNDALLAVANESNAITITGTEAKKLKRKAQISEQSLAKELKNDMNGVTKYFEIEMKSIHAHFPLTIEVKGSQILLKNMIGERAPRVLNIIGNTKVEVKGQNLKIYGTSHDDVSQTAANVRKASKIRNKDERVFQDGVYYAIEE
jgi:large subunit ribosomal protein L6